MQDTCLIDLLCTDDQCEDPQFMPPPEDFFRTRRNKTSYVGQICGFDDRIQNMERVMENLSQRLIDAVNLVHTQNQTNRQEFNTLRHASERMKQDMPTLTLDLWSIRDQFDQEAYCGIKEYDWMYGRADALWKVLGRFQENIDGVMAKLGVVHTKLRSRRRR